jgi:hypothetical protein
MVVGVQPKSNPSRQGLDVGAHAEWSRDQLDETEDGCAERYLALRDQEHERHSVHA